MYSRVRLFSNEDLAINAGAGAAALGAIYGGDVLSKKARNISYDKAVKNLKDSPKEEMDKLLKYAKSRGIKVVKNPEFDNSAYVGSGPAGIYRKAYAAKAKALRKLGKYEEARKLMEQFDSLTPAKQFLGKDAVVMGLGSDNSGALAHEIGHAEHLRKGGTGGIIGKAAHKLDTASRVLIDASSGHYIPEEAAKNLKDLKKIRKLNKGIKFGLGTAFAGGGFRRGKNSVSTDEDGKIKVNKKKALISAGIGLGVVAPTLIAEAAASRKGLKILKELGASKESLKANKKILQSALGTYAAESTRPLIAELSGHGAGVVYGVTREKKKKKNK